MIQAHYVTIYPEGSARPSRIAVDLSGPAPNPLELLQVLTNNARYKTVTAPEIGTLLNGFAGKDYSLVRFNGEGTSRDAYVGRSHGPRLPSSACSAHPPSGTNVGPMCCAWNTGIAGWRGWSRWAWAPSGADSSFFAPVRPSAVRPPLRSLERVEPADDRVATAEPHAPLLDGWRPRLAVHETCLEDREPHNTLSGRCASSRPYSEMMPLSLTGS